MVLMLIVLLLEFNNGVVLEYGFLKNSPKSWTAYTLPLAVSKLRGLVASGLSSVIYVSRANIKLNFACPTVISNVEWFAIGTI